MTNDEMTILLLAACSFAGFATDLLALEHDTFSFVRFRFAECAHFGTNLSKQLFVNTL